MHSIIILKQRGDLYLMGLKPLHGFNLSYITTPFNVNKNA